MSSCRDSAPCSRADGHVAAGHAGHSAASPIAAVGVVILAAGRGERLGRGPKAFVSMAGLPILSWTLAAVAANSCVSRIVVTAPGDAVSAVAELAQRTAGQAVDVVAGGRTRQRSAQLGVAALPATMGWAAVTDAARPLLMPGFIDELAARGSAAVRASRTSARPVIGVVPAVPIPDSVHQVGETGLLDQTLDRAALRAAQTPQLACRACLLEAYQEGERAGHSATDDAGALRQAGREILVVPGDPANIKITTPLDLQAAEAILARRGTTQGRQDLRP
jgi:2-C-methyl-D-erythritol 4-phosphate cytidylyltransferase